MNTHSAVVTVSPRAPLEIRQVVSPKLSENEVRVRNEWTTSGPLDLHKAEGGLLVTHPEVLGGGTAGVVVEIGDAVGRLKVGDKVFGYGWRSEKEKAHQTFSVLPENLLAKIPSSLKMEEAATIPTNLITVFHTLTKDLSLPLPWPKPDLYTPPNAHLPILIWGGSSSVGQYAIQVLQFYGYKTIAAISSARQHSLLKSLGATHVFDYATPIEDLAVKLSNALGHIPYFLDCIGSHTGSVVPISQLAQPTSVVAIMLPVILRDATSSISPLYSLDVSTCADWKTGVEARGVRTHFYLENEVFARLLQPEIMPTLVQMGVVRPNRVRIVQGVTMLERAQGALDLLVGRGVSGEKLVWRVSEEE